MSLRDRFFDVLALAVLLVLAVLLAVYLIASSAKARRDAEEAENDTYLRAWDSIPPAEPKHLGAYLAAVCRRLSIDRLRAGLLFQIVKAKAHADLGVVARDKHALADRK